MLFRSDVIPQEMAHLRMLEAVLFAASEPLDESSLIERLPPDADVPARLAELVRTGDDRAMVVKPLLDRIAHARNSDWAVGEEAALRLVAMLADASSSPTGPTGAGEFESESVPVGVPDA